MSKYSIAKEAIQNLDSEAEANSIDPVDAQEAMLVSLVQTMKEKLGPAHVRGILQYEIDSLGSGGVYEIQRGGGHS